MFLLLRDVWKRKSILALCSKLRRHDSTELNAGTPLVAIISGSFDTLVSVALYRAKSPFQEITLHKT